MEYEPLQRIRRIAIVGAGLVGRQIAIRAYESGFEVLLIDKETERARAAISSIRNRDARSEGSLRATDSLRDFQDRDLVVEATPEVRRVKRRVLSDVSRAVTHRCLIATNTSSIGLSELVDSVTHGTRFLALHFCHPLSQRPIVELAMSDPAEQRTLALATEFVRRLGLKPLIVPNVPGLLVNQLLHAYLNHGVELLTRGVDWRRIEAGGLRLGMPMGPLRWIDEIGLVTASRTAANLKPKDSRLPAATSLLSELIRAGRYGKASGAGFFSYAAGGQIPDSYVNFHRNAAISESVHAVTQSFRESLRAAVQRLMTLSDCCRIDDIDLALRLGLGFEDKTSIGQGLWNSESHEYAALEFGVLRSAS